MAKILQLLRNQTVFENKQAAITSLKAQLITLAAGSPAIASYTDGNKVSILLGIALDATNYQIFEGAKVGEDGNLEIPQEVQDAIKEAVDGIIGGASSEYNTLQKIETIVKGLDGKITTTEGKITAVQGELDATQTGAGLETNGNYSADGATNYIKNATSLKDADSKLDAQIKANADAIASIVATTGEVAAGNGISMEVSGKTSTISVKLNESDKVLSIDESGVLANLGLKYVKAVSDTGGTTPAKLQLIGKSDTVISDIDISDFIMDGMLENVELTGNTLTFTFNTESGKEKITVDLSNYIDVYEAGNGIDISGKTVSAKIKGAEKILKVDGEGLFIDQEALVAQVGDDKYNSALPDDLTTPSKHGGLAAGSKVSDLKQKTLSQLFDDILFEEINPTVNAPSASISPKGTWSNNGIYEVGAAAPTSDGDFNVTFNRGTCTVVGQPQKYRAGEESSRKITYKDTDLQEGQKIEVGGMSYKVTIEYGEGDEILTSKGNKATTDASGKPISENPLTGGSVSATCSIFGTYPYFCNGASASTSNQESSFPESMTPNTKLPLQKWSDTLIGAKFASEASTGTRLEFIYPKAKNVTKVEFFNTVSGKWEVFGSDKYTTSTAGQQNIQGVQVDYMKLSTTGNMSGALQLRFTVADSGRSIEKATYNGEPITDEIIGMLAKNSTTVPFMPMNDVPVVMAASTGNRPSGVANFAVNFEPGGQAPLDARTLVLTKADLIAAETYSAKNYYKGMVVTVLDDEGSIALYVLKDETKITQGDYSGWEKLDAKAAKVNAGDGISVSGDNKISINVKEGEKIINVSSDGISINENAKWDCGEY